MNIKQSSLALSLVVAGAFMVGSSHPVAAQSAIAPAGDDRFYVELKDSLLSDALEMVFRAAGNPSHIIDDAAKSINVAPIVFNNVAWDSVVRQMANQNGFKMTRNMQGTYIIEPRAPAVDSGFSEGGSPGAGFPGGGFGNGFRGGFPGGGGLGGAGSSVPPSGWNPGASGTQSSGWGSRRRQGLGGQSAVPGNPFGSGAISSTTRVNPQTVPFFGGGGGTGGTTTTTTDAAADKDFHIIPVNHVYVGGILSLFSGNVGVVSTLQFVATAAGQRSGSDAVNNNGNQNNGFGGNQNNGFGGDTSGGFGGNFGNTGSSGIGGITF
jgi:hypothetical protein